MTNRRGSYFETEVLFRLPGRFGTNTVTNRRGSYFETSSLSFIALAIQNTVTNRRGSYFETFNLMFLVIGGIYRDQSSR